MLAIGLNVVLGWVLIGALLLNLLIPLGYYVVGRIEIRRILRDTAAIARSTEAELKEMTEDG